MNRRADPARIHEARRAADLAPLRDEHHVAEDRAPELVATWEVRADAESRQHASTAFWEGFETYALERRRSG